MRWSELEHDPCPVARGLSVVGDRWTLLILRDCFRGVRRYEAFRDSLGIARHVLSDRLRLLESAGVLETRAYSDAPPRHEYRLTERGRDLYPVIVSLIRWAEDHRPHGEGAAFVFRDRNTGQMIDPVLTDAVTGRPVDARKVIAGRE